MVLTPPPEVMVLALTVPLLMLSVPLMTLTGPLVRARFSTVLQLTTAPLAKLPLLLTLRVPVVPPLLMPAAFP